MITAILAIVKRIFETVLYALLQLAIVKYIFDNILYVLLFKNNDA